MREEERQRERETKIENLDRTGNNDNGNAKWS